MRGTRTLPGTAQARCDAAVQRLGARDVTLVQVDPAPTGSLVVSAVQGAQRVFLKLAQDNDVSRQRLTQEAEAMAEVHGRWPEGVVAPLAYYDDLHALVLSDGGRQTLQAALEQADIDAACALARQAGGWLSAYHASAPQDPVKLWPKKVIVAAAPEIAAGRIASDQMCALREALLAHINTVRGAPLDRAIQHGDFHPGNLVIGAKGTLRGIDIPRQVARHNMQDVARFLVYAVWCARADLLNDAGGLGMRGAFVDAFWQGYSPERPMTLVDRFLFGVEVLRLWQTHSDRAGLAPRRVQRLTALGRIAEGFTQASA